MPLSLCLPNTCGRQAYWQAKADIFETAVNKALREAQSRGILDNLYMYAPEGQQWTR